MKKKNGFTLVELLAVIVILGILTAIAVPSVLGISKRIKENMKASKLKTIEVAAELWADDNKNSCSNGLTIQKLLDGNYLKYDDNSNFSDPVTGDDWKDKTVENLGLDMTKICANVNQNNSTILVNDIKSSVNNNTPNFNLGESVQTGVYQAEDDDGTSYYYRGLATNNYVSFAGIMWRIVRINGDGSIRLITQDTIDRFGYGLNGDQGAIAEAKKWYEENLKSYDSKIIKKTFTYYSYYTSTSYEDYLEKHPQPTFSIMGKSTYSSKIGILSLDELNFAGNNSSYLAVSNDWILGGEIIEGIGPWGEENKHIYLANNNKASGAYVESYYKTECSALNICNEIVNYNFPIRPVINLKSTIKISKGNGTQENPYVIE